MSKQYLNGVPYGVSMPYRELTQAEYDALPDSKNNDGIMYFIKNAGVAGGIKMFALADIYDTNEREIGVWIDGKPIYEKVLHITNPSTNSEITYQHNIANFNTLVSYEGNAIRADGRSFNIPTLHFTNTAYFITFYSFGDTTCKYYVGSGYSGNSSITDMYLIVRYTKTTDVPGSGSLTPQGIPAHHYSTDEHVIGTWIDGKPLYEKTFAGSFTNSSSSAQWIVILSPSDVSSLNIDTFVQGFGSFKDTFGDNYPVPNNTGSQLGLGIIDDGLCLRIQDVGNGTVYYRLTIQYTKTTD